MLRLVPHGLTVPILQGPARGLRWVVGTGTHGCWLGSYEVDLQYAVADELNPGGAFWDVGANAGFFSLIGAMSVGSSGHVVAVEPAPENVEALRLHSALNGFNSRFSIFDAAAGDVDGEAMFDNSSGRSTGRLSDRGSLNVKVVRLDTLMADGVAPPNVIKIDVEGAEADVLRGSRAVLEYARPTLFISTHGTQRAEDCTGYLRKNGFAVGLLTGSKGPVEDVLVAQPASAV